DDQETSQPTPRSFAMRTKFLMALAACAVGLSLTTGLALWSSSTTQATSAAAEERPASQLPLTHVHLFSSGVGYFQREGVVEGNTRIELTFPVQNMNDLLKSLVLQDLTTGRIRVVGYDSHEPIDNTMRSFVRYCNGNRSYTPC